MADLVYCLSNLLFFDIPLLYYYNNFRSAIIFCLPPGDMYLSFLSCLFATASELFCCEFFETFVIFFSNFITNQITSYFCCFLNYSFWTSLSTSAADCLVWSRSFWLYLPSKFLLTFLPIFFPIYFLVELNIASFFYILHLN